MKPDEHAGSRIKTVIKAVIDWLPSVAAAAAAAGILFSHTDRVNRTWFWAAALFLAAAVLLAGRKKGGIRFEKHTSIAAAALTVILLLMLSVKELIAYPLSENAFWHVLLLIALVPASFYILYRTMEWFCLPVSPVKESSLSWLRALLVIEGLLFLFANFPFRPSPDSADVYAHILSDTPRDWHTIAYHLYVWFSMRLGSRIFNWYSPFMADLIQTVIWYIILFRLGTVLRRLYGGRAEKHWLVMNAVMFIPLMYLGILYKDVIFSMCLLAFCGELLYLLSREKTDKANAAFLILFGMGASVFRHAMVVVIAATLIVVAVLFRKKRMPAPEAAAPRKLVKTVLAASLGFFLLLQGVGNFLLHMEKNPPYVKFTVPLYICGNIAAEHPELLEQEDVEMLEEVMPIETWQEAYNSNTYWADTVSRNWGVIGSAVDRIDNAYGMRIVGLNARILLRSPGAWINALTRVTSIVWQIARPQDGYEWSSAGYYWLRDDPNADPNLCSADTGVKEALEKLEYGLGDIPVVADIYYRGGIWVFLLILCGTVLILKKRVRILAAFLPPLLIFVLLMISCPSQDPRFVLPFTETGLLMLVTVRHEQPAETCPAN